MEEYESQLLAVEQALAVTAGISERGDLEALRANLLELLELTKETTAGIADEAQPISGGSAANDQLDDEMQRFMSEIGQLETGNCDDRPEDAKKQSKVNLQELRANLEQMVGEKCSAPHQHSWGAVGYHNAIVCGIEEETAAVAENGVDGIDDDGGLDVRLRVLFTNPTHREMLPCTFYLEGECRFDATRCHYSHGELVAAADLREYTPPNFELLARNCVVLAKLSKDRLWHRGRVLCVNFVEKLCRVRLDGKEHKERERDFAFEELFPIFHDEDLSSGSSSDSMNESDSEELNDLEASRHAQLVEQSLFTFQPTQALGEWEKHTRGIGSKLMAKMGYVHGTGLGSDGRGIITPVSAQILPQGRSLDHCMELREAANGDKDLFSVEKKLQREQKKQLALNAKSYERETQRVDVFSFLNESILAGGGGGGGHKTKKEIAASTAAPSALQQQTNKSLNVQSVRIADDIRRKEREIDKVHVSLRRHASGTEVHKRLQSQLNMRKQELHALKSEEKCLTKEQATRRTKDKLSVF